MLVQVAGLREERRRWQALLASQATLQNEVDMWRHRWGLRMIKTKFCPVEMAAHTCVQSSVCVWIPSLSSLFLHASGRGQTDQAPI